MEFYEWINDKYRNWCNGKRDTITNFAKYVGVPQTVMSSWMTKGGKSPRDHTTVTKLVNRFGAEVYEVLDLSAPTIGFSLSSFPSEIRELFLSAQAELNSEYAKVHVSPDSPEALKIAETVLSRYGIKINSVEHVDEV